MRPTCRFTQPIDMKNYTNEQKVFPHCTSFSKYDLQKLSPLAFVLLLIFFTVCHSVTLTQLKFLFLLSVSQFSQPTAFYESQ